MSGFDTPQNPQNPQNPQFAQNPQNPQFSGQFGAAPIPAPMPQKKKGGCFKWGGITAGVIIVAAALASLNGGTDSDNKASSALSSVSNSESSVAAGVADSGVAAMTEDAEVNSTPPVGETKQDEVPKEYKNALRKAKTYSDMMHMSKAGIYDQLTSEYGEQFSAEAAQYAIDNLDADWNKNALEKARTYQDSMAMSPDAIYEQLVSEYGEKFTAEEAQYAVDNL